MCSDEVKSHNFRSIHDAEILLEPLPLISEANNSGRSNVIDVIRLFNRLAPFFERFFGVSSNGDHND